MKTDAAIIKDLDDFILFLTELANLTADVADGFGDRKGRVQDLRKKDFTSRTKFKCSRSDSHDWHPCANPLELHSLV